MDDLFNGAKECDNCLLRRVLPGTFLCLYSLWFLLLFAVTCGGGVFVLSPQYNVFFINLSVCYYSATTRHVYLNRLRANCLLKMNIDLMFT